VLQTAEQRYATLQTRYDVAGRRILGWTVGLALVVALVVLDAIPLNWAAQAFGLDSGGTWLVTCILVVASVGAMVGFELTSGYSRQRSLLAAVVGVAYLVLLGLRTQFLTTVAGESTPVALLQSAMLTVISAGLVLCGSAVLARTRSFTLSYSLGIVRRARRDAATARIAQERAGQRLQRHIGALWQLLLPWALGTAAPAGVDRAKWAVALRQSVRQLFPVP
jgi:fucose 4-O-acetylase-like acetyltransferase